MSSPKYQTILGVFVAITILLALILWAIIAYNGDEEVEQVAGWKTVTIGEISFQYPETLPTLYVSVFDWPPALRIIDERFSCSPAGDSFERAGRTELRSVGGKNYCITEIVEGAAGSIYTQYAYAFEYENDTAILTFSTRAPQCGNYPEPELSACEAERASFNLDALVAQIAETVED